MNLDDRLRSHLQDQTTDLTIEPEGVDAVRSRSRQRKQRRATAGMLSVLALALVVGGFFLNRSDDSPANLATEGDDGNTSGSTSAAVSDEGQTPGQLPQALPEPGHALTFTAVNNDGAPGGYNIFTAGHANGLTYVVSTAPGLTYDDLGDDGFFRNDTIYTFDGSSWQNSTAGDRFISRFDAASTGLLYAVSTGSPTSQALEVGVSANAGADWEWTEIDLTSLFGDDRSAWPPYIVEHASHEDQQLIVVHTTGFAEHNEALRLAIKNGAPISETADIFHADHLGISWFDDVESGLTQCQAAESEALESLWNDVAEVVPEFDFDREPTEAERAELRAYYEEQERQSIELRDEALEIVAGVPGCESYVKCSTDLNALAATTDANIEALYEELGIDMFFDENPPTGQAFEQLEAAHAAQQAEIEAWVEDSSCGDVLPYFDYAYEEDSGPRFMSWAELGVTAPESWTPTSNLFLVDGGEIADLGQPLDTSGFPMEVIGTDSGWSIMVDTTSHNPESRAAESFVEFTSADGLAWGAGTPTQFSYGPSATLADGITFSLSWTESQAGVVRSHADGTSALFELEDLAPDLDTRGYQLAYVATGEYGVVITAISWEDSNDSMPGYDSLVLYSPDGTSWGATELPDVEVVQTVVTNDGVLIFLNDPAREEGAPQPVLYGR